MRHSNTKRDYHNMLNTIVLVRSCVQWLPRVDFDRVDASVPRLVRRVTISLKAWFSAGLGCVQMLLDACKVFRHTVKSKLPTMQRSLVKYFAPLCY